MIFRLFHMHGIESVNNIHFISRLPPFSPPLLSPPLSPFLKEIIQGLFDNGFMSIEIPEEYGGVGAGFTACCLVIEEYVVSA